MNKHGKQIVSFLLIICLLAPNTVYAEENPDIFGSIGDFFGQMADDTANLASGAWDEWSNAVVEVWDGWSNAVIDGWNGVSSWTIDSWEGISLWTVQAWEDSYAWVVQAWEDSTSMIVGSWDNFILWVNMVISGNPYSWIGDIVLENGILGYDSYASIRSFLDTDPDLEQFRAFYEESLEELSLLKEDRDTLWDMLINWAEEKELSPLQIAEIAMPFLERLVIEGESAIGQDVIFSGPVIGQYLITILETMNLDSSGTAEMKCKIFRNTLDGLTRPVIIGDVDQNTLITEDQYYIEYYSYDDGKYQIVMIVSEADDESRYPLLREGPLDEMVKRYFIDATTSDSKEITIGSNLGQSIGFSYNVTAEEIIEDEVIETTKDVTGKAVVIWTYKCNYVFFVLTDQEWSEDEYEEWFESVATINDETITFEVDMESDGSFYGVNQASQKYTINRVFDEAKFSVPKTGHGWAAERGNNLIDNVKGFVQREHSTIIGDNNAKNGPDRVTTYSDGSKLLIQSKYYKTASRSISACFEDNKFRYIDAEGKPMAVEVPANQYDAAVDYMKNRISNGEVPGVTDPESAIDIVKRGNLTYDQARHIAKAGTVESILYDSAQACVTAGTSIGISAAVGFAINIWNGESIEVAIKESILQGLKTGGTAFIISVLSSQLAKTGLNTAMIPASRVIVHALGPKVSAVIVNAFRPAGSAIYGRAALQSAAKLLRGNVITSTVTFVVLSAEDVTDMIRGRISWTQLAKNMSSTAAGLTGGVLGYLGGAAIGTAIFPGAGTVVGIIISVAAGWGASEGASAIGDMIAEDDANQMIRIIEEQFSIIAPEYFLSEKEVDKAVMNFQTLVSAEMLKQMYQYGNYEVFARQLIELAIDPVVAEREYIELPDEDEYSKCLTEVLETIYDDVKDETIITSESNKSEE